MRDGWEVKKLGDVCAYDKIKYISTDLPYVGLESIESKTGKFIGSLEVMNVKSSTFCFSDEHLLYGRLRPYLNKVLIPNFEGHCSTEIFPIKIGDKILREFLFYWFISETTVEKIDATWTGARMPRANMKEVINFELPIPPLPEQTQIVNTLDKAFKQIGQAKANLEKNLANAKELFASKLNEVFSQRGEGWVEKRLGDVCKIVGGGTPSKSNKEFYTGTILWASVRDMKNDILIDTELKITEEAIKKSSTNLIPKSSVIIATRVGLGKVCLLKFDTTINQDLKGILVKDNFTILNEFIFWWFKSISSQIIAKGTGLTVQGVKLDYIKALYFPYIALGEQQRVVNLLNKLDTNIKKIETHYQQKLNNLEELKKSILQKAFNGELEHK